MSLGAAAVAEAARHLSRGRLEGRPIDQLPAPLAPADENDAYAIQTALHGILTEAGRGALAGHKIGCTTPVMQRFLNIPNPCAGGVFAETVHHEEGRFRCARFHHVGVECEIAVRLDAPLGADGRAGRPHDRNTVAAAVGAVMAAIEVVDDRYVDYERLGALTLIGDDFFNAGCVLGSPVAGWRALDLAALPGTMKINGEPVGAGAGGDIMGHPLEALAWLANMMAARGRTLAPGEFVLLGSLVETKWVAAGDRVDIAVEALGTASAFF